MLVWMAPLAMPTIGMMVALRITRNIIVWMRPVAMLIFGMMLSDCDFPEAPKMFSSLPPNALERKPER